MSSRQRRLTAVLVLTLAVSLGGGSLAGQLGDQAPELQVAEWVKGGPVTLAEGKGKTIFVVEFWATWCPPCKDSIPHLTELQNKLNDKGVVIVGVSLEDASTIREFVEEMGSKMDYAVAVDDNGTTSRRYLEPWGIEGIPHAFVVDTEGRIAWHGHPMAQLGEVLEAMLSGEYDIRTAQLYERAFELIGDYYERATRSLNPEEKKGLSALGARILDLTTEIESADLLNAFAWVILKDEEIRERDLELALKAGKAAYDLSEGKVADVIDTYAWALFENGRVAEAIEMEKSALALSTDEEERAYLSETLELFQQKAEQSG